MGGTTLVLVADDQCIARDRNSDHDFIATTLVVVSMRCVNRHMAVGDSFVILTQRIDMVFYISLEGRGSVHVVKVNTRWNAHDANYRLTEI